MTDAVDELLYGTRQPQGPDAVDELLFGTSAMPTPGIGQSGPDAQAQRDFPPGIRPAEFQQKRMEQQLDDGDDSTLDTVGDFITGNNRQTQATDNLPGLFEMGIGPFLGETRQVEKRIPRIGRATAKSGGSAGSTAASAALLQTFDPEEARAILSNAAGREVAMQTDEKGNIIFALDGRKVLFNPPGFDRTDAAQLAGGVAAFTPAGRAGMTGTTITRQVAKAAGASALTQAGIEAGQADVGGEFNPTDVAITGGFGGGGQLVASALVRLAPGLRQLVRESGITQETRRIVRETAVKLGFKPEDITDEVIDGMLVDAQQAVSPTEALAIAGEREFNVPLKQGERSLNPAQLSAEDSMRVGMRGTKAQEVVREFETGTQRPAINNAVETIETRLGADGTAIGNPNVAGASVKQGIRSAEDAANTVVQDAYAAVGDATLSVEGMSGLLKATRNSMRAVEFDKSLKGTASLLESARQLQGTIKAFESGGNLRPFHMKQVEQLRRRIRTAFDSAENAADKRQVGIVRDAFDDYMDTAVAKGLIAGNQASISALKAARATMKDYADLFFPREKTTRGGVRINDPSGRLIQKIIEGNPTDEDVTRAMFGANAISGAGGAGMVQRFRNILGADSPEWGQIRQAAFRRIIQTGRENGQDVVSADKSLTAFNNAIDKNPTLMGELFSREEQGLIRRFLIHVKRTQADIPRSRENPSGTGQKITKAVGDMLRRVGAIFGAAGDPTVILTSAGVETAQGMRAASQARSSVRPFEAIITGRAGTEVIPAAASASAAPTTN